MANTAAKLQTSHDWIVSQQHALNTDGYGTNKKAVNDELQEQTMRQQTITSYQSELNDVIDSVKDQQDVTKLQASYNNLKTTADRRTECLTLAADVDRLEDLFGPLTNEFALKATELVTQQSAEHKLSTLCIGSTSNSAQRGILAVRHNWAWISKLLKCSEIQLQSAAEYHQFFYEVAQNESWMLDDMRGAAVLLDRASIKKNMPGYDASRMLFELKTALSQLLNWSGKCDAMFERCKKVVPVHLRTKKLDHNVPVKALANYKTTEISIVEGEELTLIDNSLTQMWQVTNTRAQTSVVPSAILVIPGPDINAVQAAIRLRLQLLACWTNDIKRFGKTIIWFLLQVIRDWTPEEIKMLHALNATDKSDLLSLMFAIEKTFSPYWDNYKPYILLHKRVDNLRDIINDKQPNGTDGFEPGRLLVIQTNVLHELLARYRDYWLQWETFKILTETTRHPEYLLVATTIDDYKFLDLAEWLKKWQTTLEVEDDEEEQVVIIEPTESASLQSEVINIETNKETTETSHVTTSEQEERQTFVITGVIDPRTETEISLDRAISEGIINQKEGRYVNPITRESVPIPVAMNAGKIKVELTTVKKSAEKRSDVCLVTIKTYKESRPFTVKAVVDANSDRQMSVQEAQATGILDQAKGVYINKSTGDRLSLADALDSGLLIVEFDQSDAKNGNGDSSQDVVSKTYAIRAVVDVKNKKRLSFKEALETGLINTDSGSYHNNSTDEDIYLADAIRKGFIKATVVNDLKTLESSIIAAGGHVTVNDSAFTNFRKKMAQPIAAMSALKKAAQANNDVTNGTHSPSSK